FLVGHRGRDGMFARRIDAGIDRIEDAADQNRPPRDVGAKLLGKRLDVVEGEIRPGTGAVEEEFDHEDFLTFVVMFFIRRHVWTAPCRQGFFGVSANGSGSGHVYGLEMRPVAVGPEGERGSNSNHCGALLRAMTARSVSIPVS